MSTATNKFHLPGLNGLRALAATFVIVAHSMQQFAFHRLDTLSSYAVTLFFCLSGFLITLLLLREKERTGGISVINFYIRRTLRIWPLYFGYLALALATTIAAGLEPISFSSVAPYLFFFPNFANHHTLVWHYWSLGVEEQFYLFWPFLMLLIPRSYFKYFLGFTIAWIALRLGLRSIFGDTSAIYQSVFTLRFSCMSIGALGAVIFNSKWSRSIRFLCAWPVELGAWLVIILIMLNVLHISSLLDHEIFSVAVVSLIVSQITGKALLPLENKVFNFFGAISFGLYVIHPLIQFFLKRFLMAQDYNFSSLYNWPLFFAILYACTTGLAYLSYRYYESRFLKLKNRFEKTPTQANKPALVSAQVG